MPGNFNVIFIVVDTLRKDYAGSLERELKKLGFVSYENVVAPASWTLPSHVSMFTGLYPAFHGVHETKTKKHVNLRVSKKIREMLISHTLRDLGLNTYLVTANIFVSPYFGIDGFLKVYDIVGIHGILSDNTIKVLQQIGHNHKNKLNYLIQLLHLNKYSALIEIALKYPIYFYHKRTSWPLDKGAKYAVKKLKSMLAVSGGKSSNFIFMNLMEVHEPYFKKEGNVDRNFIMNIRTNRLDPYLVQKWKEKYPKEVTYVTRKILDMMRILKEKGVFDNSLVIVTSDHGQLLGEHGRISHGTFLYDELLRVPLLIKYPIGYEIERTENESKYISLVKLKPFILGMVDNKLSDDNVLYDGTVFAESYGIHQNVGEVRTEEEKKNVDQLEKYRIAIYYKNFKGIFNVTDWKFEEIISHNPQIAVTEDVVKHMKKEVMKFLKTATVAKVPKIKI